MLRLVTFRSAKNTSNRVGALVGPSAVLDLTQYSSKLKGYLPPPAAFTESAARDMLALIESGDESAQWLHSVVKGAEADPQAVLPSLLSLHDDDVALQAPIPVPRRNIMCVGKNYRDHINEVAAADKLRSHGAPNTPSNPSNPTTTTTTAAVEPKYAQFFTKATTTVVGPGAAVESHPGVTQWLDYEAELAVVIGKRGRDIPRERAMQHVFGFTIANDVTSRDVQRRHNQWFRGKSLDSTCPMGPFLLHAASSVESAVCDTQNGSSPSHTLTQVDPQRLDIRLWLNGELRQCSNTRNMLFSIPELIAQLSQGLTLLPGDVLLTGTPSGVGYAMTPPRVLKAGDHCAIEIEHLGRLENTLV